MRVVHLGHSAGLGGIAVAIRQSCLALRAAGCEVLLIGNGGDDSALRDAGIKIGTVSWRHSGSGFAKSTGMVREMLRSFKPAVCHCHARMASLITRLTYGVPDVFQIHGAGIVDRAGWFDYDWVRPLIPTGRHIITLNAEAAQWARRVLRRPAENVHIVPHGVDCEHFRPPSVREIAEARHALGVPESHFVTTFAGRFHPKKQPGHVLALARALRQRGTHGVSVVLVGDGRLRTQLDASIRKDAIGDTCRIAPWMDPRTAYWASDLIVMPSLVEGFGLVCAEAMACGRPVLRTRTGGFEWMVREGVTGFGCDLSESGFVARALELIEAPHLLCGVGAAARAHIAATLSPAAHANHLIRVYEAAVR